MVHMPDALTILVVDDDALISMSMVDMLEDLGHQVLEASSGAQALEIVKAAERIDLVITDYSMPGMNGAELAMGLRRIRNDLPVLVATGYADLPPDAGIDLPRLGKPYSQEQLAREISNIFSARNAEA
ncbi:response regulator [Neorhizobium lilium]|uniref:Response regulator n=1 Tax=Neorhizobium lilium TaxID=2503024 RepID=A0A3S3T094_9HYPH|nr:response regulator [Neorhizobium lilium]